MPDHTTTHPTDPDRAPARTIAALAAVGITDPAEQEHLHHILTQLDLTVQGLPTSAHGAAIDVLFHRLDNGDRIALGNLIAKQDPHHHGPGWPDWLHNALDNAENSDRITAGQAALNDALDAATLALHAVARARDTLIQEYDTNHTETGDGDLFDHYLTKARRALSTAALVNPTRGEEK